MEIIAHGNSRYDGKGKVSKGIGYKRRVLKIYPNAKFKYRIGNDKGVTTGYYNASALKKL